MKIFEKISWKTVFAFAVPMVFAAIEAFTDKQQEMKIEKLEEDVRRLKGED